MFNYEQWMSAVRWALATSSGFVLGKGWVDAATWGMISGAISSLAPLGWGLLRHTRMGTLLAATEVPGTEKVVNPQLSSQTPNPKVSSS